MKQLITRLALFSADIKTLGNLNWRPQLGPLVVKLRRSTTMGHAVVLSEGATLHLLLRRIEACVVVFKGNQFVIAISILQ